ncbi:MAG TPA: NTP transferase domain-containing protein [Candidatus Limnocylindrales bacterium]
MTSSPSGSASPDVVAIVLAGGAASRFGSDKLATDLDGRPLLHHALEAVAAVADRIVVVIAPEAPLPSVPEGFARRVVFARDAAAHGGPLAGLGAGLAAIDTPVREDASHISGPEAGGFGPVALVLGGDMPSLVPAVLRLLAETLASDPSLAAMTLAAPGPAPLPMAVSPDAVRTAIDAILASGGRRSLLALLDAVPSATLPGDRWRPLDPSAATLRDIDTPADLQPG